MQHVICNIDSFDEAWHEPAPKSILVDGSKLLAAYIYLQPDPGLPELRVEYGTSGHRGSLFDRVFSAWHILAISQAIRSAPCGLSRKNCGVASVRGIPTHQIAFGRHRVATERKPGRSAGAV